MTRRTSRPSTLVLLALAAGCGEDLTTAQLPGLDALEPMDVPAPAARPGDPHPEVLDSRSGNNQATGFDWSQGHGYVHASVASVYLALHDPAVITDRRRVSEYSSTPNTDPTYPFSFRVHNIVHDIITIEFDVSVRMGTTAGTEAAPTTVGLRYQKTFGSSFIALLRGSVIARQVDANTTEIEMVREVTGTSPEAAETNIHDVYDSVVARVHGRAIPTY